MSSEISKQKNLPLNLARPKNIGGPGKLKQVYENKEIIFMSLITRLFIVVAIVVSISEIVSFALIQKYGTILVIIPIIIVEVVAIGINITYKRKT